MHAKALVERTLGWMRRHPKDVVGAMWDAAGFRLTVPLDALRWLASLAKGRSAPEDLEISSEPPGLRIGATLNVMKTKLRATGTLYIDETRFGPEELRFTLRLRNVALAVIGDSDSPVATLIKSGALDLSKPGKVVSSLPKRPPFIIEADGDRLVLDIIRVPKIAHKARRIATVVTPILTVSSIESRGDRLSLKLACFPEGLLGAVESLR